MLRSSHRIDSRPWISLSSQLELRLHHRIRLRHHAGLWYTSLCLFSVAATVSALYWVAVHRNRAPRLVPQPLRELKQCVGGSWSMEHGAPEVGLAFGSTCSAEHNRMMQPNRKTRKKCLLGNPSGAGGPRLANRAFKPTFPWAMLPLHPPDPGLVQLAPNGPQSLRSCDCRSLPGTTRL